jgi:phospholipid transport system substrate-binding protein
MTRIKNLLVSLFGLVALSFASQSMAIDNPSTLISQTVNNLQTEITSQHASLANSPEQLFAVIKKTVMPIIDVDQMAAMTLGPKWRDATPQEKNQFIDQFGLLLTKTYANALLTVSDYNITIYPVRGNAWKTENYVAVNGIVTPKNGGQSSAVTYYLERSGNGWKIYDMAVEGVSFMKNFQSQFQSFASMQALLARLTEMNAQQ